MAIVCAPAHVSMCASMCAMVLTLGLYGLYGLYATTSSRHAGGGTDEVSVDVSGYGTCFGDRVNVSKAWVWTQHPAPLEVQTLVDYSMLKEFKGRNSIAWSDEGERLVGFDVKDVVGRTIVADRPLFGSGKCHFTLDAVLNRGFSPFPPMPPNSPYIAPPPLPPLPLLPRAVDKCIKNSLFQTFYGEETAKNRGFIYPDNPPYLPAEGLRGYGYGRSYCAKRGCDALNELYHNDPRDKTPGFWWHDYVDTSWRSNSSTCSFCNTNNDTNRKICSESHCAHLNSTATGQWWYDPVGCQCLFCDKTLDSPSARFCSPQACRELNNLTDKSVGSFRIAPAYNESYTMRTHCGPSVEFIEYLAPMCNFVSNSRVVSSAELDQCNRAAREATIGSSRPLQCPSRPSSVCESDGDHADHIHGVWNHLPQTGQCLLCNRTYIQNCNTTNCEAHGGNMTFTSGLPLPGTSATTICRSNPNENDEYFIGSHSFNVDCKFVNDTATCYQR